MPFKAHMRHKLYRIAFKKRHMLLPRQTYLTACISFGKGQNRDVKYAPQDISSSGLKKIFVTLLNVWWVTCGMDVIEKDYSTW